VAARPEAVRYGVNSRAMGAAFGSPFFYFKPMNLDTLFSKYIRQKYADFGGYVECAHCGVVRHWKEMECGHYMKRRHRATRYDERNAAPLCSPCNQRDEEIRPWLVREFGETEVQDVERKAKRIYKKGPVDDEMMKATLQQKLKELP